MARVYRLETSCGTGVFDAGAVYEYQRRCSPLSPDPYSQPSPCSEGIKFDYDHRCGFESIEQMREWFADLDAYDAFDEFKILVRLFEVDDQYVKKGRKQVVFYRHLAKIVEERTPTDFATRLLAQV